VSRNVDRLASMVHTVSLTEFVATVGQWLRDAHEAAQELQPFRRQNQRGSWANNTSFGTDRYQYLLRTAGSLVADLPDLEVATAHQSVLFKLPRAGIYPLSVPHGPDGPVEARDLRRQLMEQRQEWALFDRQYALLGERQVVLMPWSGSDVDGLTGMWAGQGVLADGRITWEWRVQLVGAIPGPRQPGQGGQTTAADAAGDVGATGDVGGRLGQVPAGQVPAGQVSVDETPEPAGG
jgi:hypothetical protein